TDVEIQSVENAQAPVRNGIALRYRSQPVNDVGILVENGRASPSRRHVRLICADFIHSSGTSRGRAARRAAPARCWLATPQRASPPPKGKSAGSRDSRGSRGTGRGSAERDARASGARGSP